MTPSFSSLIKLLVFCSAFLVPGEARPHRRLPRVSNARSVRSILGAYTVPLTNGTVTLPVPSPNLCLKAIALGRGTQNYTCATSDASSVPSSIGAVATLFDASPLLPFLSPIDGQEILDLLPEYLLTFPSAALQSSNLPMLGQHFFTAPTSPIFNLMPGNIGFLEGAKVGDIIAPAGSPPGPYGKGNGAVDWLALSAKPGSVDIQQGYRVFTAGGKAPATCAGQQPTIEVQYAAQYWFYG